jgi:hypothetical protein
MNIDKSLAKFAKDENFTNKGPLCVALIVTKHAIKKGLPLEAEDLLTKSGGQVVGLGKSSVQSILKSHGIKSVLAEEGGRTSRGSVGNMRKYVEFLNKLNPQAEQDLHAIEAWWISRVKKHFAGKPFTLRFDASKSLRSVIRDLFAQAEKRQAKSSGYTIVGTMLQHLVGAKLNLLLDKKIEHHGASVADRVSNREGDFLIEDVAIHVTTTPGEALIRKCQSNLNAGFKPVIITTDKGVAAAEVLAGTAGISDRVDVFDAEQFLAGNLYELGKFKQIGRKATADQLIEEYNKIIESCETDPSLRIEFLK